MRLLANIDLRQDADARTYIKEEIVSVNFATEPGELISLEGPNRYARGDAIITAATGERWCVSRDRFDGKYHPVAPLQAGYDGEYRNRPVQVLAKQMHSAFSIARSQGGDVLHGDAGDWLMQYAPGDFGITAAARFTRVYGEVISDQ
jgi:hypothetical protein